jgi:hypothetical protein
LWWKGQYPATFDEYMTALFGVSGGSQMYIPVKARITLLIVAGIGVGTGAVTFAALLSNHEPEPIPTIGGIGAMILAASVAALIAHLAGGFRDIEDDGQP